jgi:hypothetical protein
VALLDTYESQLDEDERIKPVEKFKTYLMRHWENLYG